MKTAKIPVNGNIWLSVQN